MEGRLASPSETRQCQTASYFHRLSLSLILLMQTSRRVASKNTMPRTQGIIQLSASQHKICFRRRYVSAPTSLSTCTHLHSCQSLRPKSQASTNPQFPNPVTLPTPMYLTSTAPYLLTATATFYTPTPSLPFPAITYQPRRPHMQADLHHLPNPNLALNSPLLIPQPTNLSPATPQPSQAKPSQFNSTSKQIKSPQGTLFRPHIAMTPQSSHNLISVVWTPRPHSQPIFP